MTEKRQSREATEKATLDTFRTHRPSEYFSHLDYHESFEKHHSKMEELYRFGLRFPPEMFKGKTVVDLGCGTGENTVSMAIWGAQCTLVELNDEAVARARGVFSQLAPDDNYRFLNRSIYDLEHDGSELGSFDIAHSRGVLMHVADKPKAFAILAGLVKDGGYVIYGDRNTAGGVQEMLQRMAIYQLAGDSSEMICSVAELLFEEDIDRSHQALPRTREAIIFDRWVIQQQDDPSVSEVLGMFETHGLRLYSTWPPMGNLVSGDSTLSKRPIPRGDEGFVTLTETLWMIQNAGHEENIQSIEGVKLHAFHEGLLEFSEKLRNLQIGDRPDFDQIKELAQKMKAESNSAFNFGNLETRMHKFFTEVSRWVELLASGADENDLLSAKNEFKVLFRGLMGVRHVDYVGYKEA